MGRFNLNSDFKNKHFVFDKTNIYFLHILAEHPARLRGDLKKSGSISINRNIHLYLQGNFLSIYLNYITKNNTNFYPVNRFYPMVP